MTEVVMQTPIVREPRTSMPAASSSPSSIATELTSASASVVAEYAAAFGALVDAQAFAGESQWLGSLRRGALRRLEEIGFPTTKNEDWHFTNPTPLTWRCFAPDQNVTPGTVTAEQLAPYLFDGDWATVVFVDGRYDAALSRGVETNVSKGTIGSLREAFRDDLKTRMLERLIGGAASYQENAFTALNTAFLQDGVFVHAPSDVTIGRPVHVLHVITADARDRLVSPRTLIVADTHAALTVVESFVSFGETSHFTNAVSEVYLAPGARVRHYKIQREALDAVHVGSTYTHQAQDSNYESFSFAVGASLSRTNISTVLDGPGAHATVNGVYMVAGTQTVDHQTRIEHARENCTSHEVYRGILDGESHGVFNGKVYVRPEAQKTDGKQSNNNLLLSDRAKIDTKPQLEIFADDVKCTHGATIGRLDPTALFYLKSRGVGTERARQLLTYAFAADVLEQITVEPVKARLEELAFERFTA